ncbi:MAG: hypothetical protein ACRD4X_19170 [Candidatus Acidiferrales bacterium]
MRIHQIQKKACIGLFLAGALLAAPSPTMAGGGADAAGSAGPSALPAAPRPTAAPAQESQALESLRLEEPKIGKNGIRSAEEGPSRRKWIALALAEHSAAAFDSYTTRRAIRRGAVEADPLMRPFAGSPSIYAAIQIAPLALDYAARRMQRSQSPFIRKLWWLPQTGGTAMYLFSGTHNLGVAGRL